MEKYRYIMEKKNKTVKKLINENFKKKLKVEV